MRQPPSQHQQLHQAVNSAAMIMLFDSENDDSELEEFYSYCRSKLQKRYLNARGTTTRSHPRYDLSIMQGLSESCFLQLFQMAWPCFLNLLQLIESHPIFYNSSWNPQRDPSVQLAVAICRLGSNGNGAAVFRLKNLFHVGYGTINLYTTRVTKVIYQMRPRLASWPTSEEQLELSQVMQEEGFPGCIGFVDGTTIPLSQKPPIDGNHYFDREKRYSISLTLVCDVNKKFISYLAGYPGSCHDCYVFSNMQLAQQPEQFFDQNQFLLADSAYPSNQYTIPAYKGADLLIPENVDFNYHLAQSRVRIEHAIGILKGRFASLREMRSQIRNRHEMKEAIKWIISCVVLHNLLADLKDQWNKLYEEEEPEPAPPVGQENEDSNDGLRGVLRPITLSHFA
ncbi:hypothetical protein PCASD_11644 [Puccinia coronata f. sp. avenae]|uniref:DDE Tnp4 domain-containing protein n=1 Tax=Puccinia coronata f. sp. avenae TaxID=200324 RepID=A0A2N5TA95_9BASI|nr:hypothetical protein PCASD_11644 [Puccinia coronata f. sp. avenae]